jgi:hypothetical protein
VLECWGSHSGHEHEIKWERYREDVSTIVGPLVCKWTADIPVASTQISVGCVHLRQGVHAVTG